ncbi:MAG: class I SAM-dependent methyltransferase [Planctomycetota bacterium]
MILSIPNSVRFWLRSFLYRTLGPNAVHRIKQATGAPDVHEDPAYWNAELSGRLAAPNLNGRVCNALRHSTTAQLIRVCGPRPAAVLDIGCGYCELARMLADDGLTRYVGVDLSGYAIDRARREHPGHEFHQADLRGFKADETFDVIVFNDVLKYVDVGEAVGQVERYGGVLAPDGVFCVTLTDDPKCRAIFRKLGRGFEWVHGAVYQARPEGPRFRVTRSRAMPAYLVGIFRPGRTW